MISESTSPSSEPEDSIHSELKQGNGTSLEVDGTLERLRTLLAKTKKERPEVASLLTRGGSADVTTDVNSLAANFFQGTPEQGAAVKTDTARLRKAKQYVAGLEQHTMEDDKENSGALAAAKKIAAQQAELAAPSAIAAVSQVANALNQKTMPLANHSNRFLKQNDFGAPGCFSDSAKRFLAAHQKVKR